MTAYRVLYSNKSNASRSPLF